MDRWGRPDINTGLGFARGLMQIKDFQGRQKDRALGLKDRKSYESALGMPKAAYEGKLAKSVLKEEERSQRSEANIEKYIPMVQQGIEPNRKAEDFSYVDWLGAQTKVQQTLNADVNYQNNMLIKENNERTANEAKINNMIATAEIYAGQGDDTRAAEILAPMYNLFPDNQEFVGVNPDNPKQWIMKDQRTSEEHMIDALPYGQVVPMAKKFSKTYRTVDEGFQKKRRLHNNAEITKWDVWTTSGGKEALHFTFLDKNGAMREIWKDPKTGEVLKGFDVRTGQIVKSELDFRPLEYWQDKTGAKTGLTPSQEINLRQDIHKEKIRINEAFGKINYKPIKPDKAKDMPKYNKQMRAWTIAQVTNEYEQMKRYYGDVLGERAGGQVNQMAMSMGNRLFRMFNAIGNPKEEAAFVQNIKAFNPELFAAFREAAARYDAKQQGGGTSTKKPEPTKKLSPKTTGSLSKNTGAKDYGLGRRTSLSRSVGSAATSLSRSLGGSRWPGDKN